MLRAMLPRSGLQTLAAAFACCVMLGGCAYGYTRQIVRAQFAAELDCPEVKMVRRPLWYVREGARYYKVSGCGVLRTYKCPGEDSLTSYDESPCTWTEGDIDAPKIGGDADQNGAELPAGDSDATADDVAEDEGSVADEADEAEAGAASDDSEDDDSEDKTDEDDGQDEDDDEE